MRLKPEPGRGVWWSEELWYAAKERRTVEVGRDRARETTARGAAVNNVPRRQMEANLSEGMDQQGIACTKSGVQELKDGVRECMTESREAFFFLEAPLTTRESNQVGEHACERF